MGRMNGGNPLNDSGKVCQNRKWFVRGSAESCSEGKNGEEDEW